MSGSGRPRLLVLTSTFPRRRGDATPGFVAELALRLGDRFEVTVLAPALPGAPAEERWGPLRVRRFRYGWPEGSQRLADGAILPNLRRSRLLYAQAPAFVAAEFLAAWRLMRTERFDAVHAHWVLPQGLVAAALGRRFGVPVVVTAHGADLYALRSPPLMRLKRAVLQRADALTAVSASLAGEMQRLGAAAERVEVIPMGVDTDRFRPEARSMELRARLNPDGPALLFVGRLAEKKGARYAIEAMPAVLARHPAARLTLAGDGPERIALERLAAALGLGEQVRFAGPVPHDELPAYYASADLLVGPSVQARDGDAEAFGLVFAEALAAGCPVIATATGGIGDVVRDDVNGLLVPQRDSRAIAEALHDLLSNRGRLQRLRAAARASVSRFDTAHAAHRYAAVLERVLR